MFKSNSMKVIFKQFFAFSFVGGIAASIHFTVLIFSVQVLNLSPVFGSIAGFLISVIFNYLLNYHFTFKSQNSHKESSIKFCIISLTGLILNTILMIFFIKFLHYIVSQIVVASIVLIWNFICNRYWTFKEINFAKQ